MRRFLLYTALQLKRSLKFLPKVAMFAVVLIVSAGVFCSVLVMRNEYSSKKAMVKVGITGDTDNPYVKLALLAVREFDSSGSYIEIVQVNENQALDSVKRGDLSGCVVVPEGFVDAVLWGGDVQLTYILRNNPVGLNTLLTNEIVSVISDMVSEAIAGIIATQNLAGAYDLTEDSYGLMEDINIRYVTYVLDRDSLYEVSYTGIYEGLSFGGYYVAGMLFLLTLLMGIVCAPMMVRQDMSMARLAKTRGIRVYQQITGEWIGFSFAALTVMSVIVVLLMIATDYVAIPIPEVQNLSRSTIGAFVPVVLMAAAMQMLLYECCSGIIAGVLLQFIVTMAMGYISGCFYPIYFFPEIIQTVSSILPGGVAMDYIGGLLTGHSVNVLSICGYSCVMLFLAGMVRRLKMRRDVG